MRTYSDEKIINVGTGEDQTILDLAHRVAQVVGYAGKIVMDTSKPDGTPRKLLEVSRLRDLGWVSRISLPEGIAATYQDYCRSLANVAD